MISQVLRLSDRITYLPVIHGSGEFALVARRLMLEETFDCVAIPLPPSFQAEVERGIELLPRPMIVTQAEAPRFHTEWTPEGDHENEDDTDLENASDAELTHSYVPIDPCQPVIAALRAAM